MRTSLSDIRRAVAAKLFTRSSAGPAADTVRFADLELCRRTRVVLRGGEPIELTPIEFDLLELLMRHPGEVLPRSTIAEKSQRSRGSMGGGAVMGSGSNSSLGGVADLTFLPVLLPVLRGNVKSKGTLDS